MACLVTDVRFEKTSRSIRVLCQGQTYMYIVPAFMKFGKLHCPSGLSLWGDNAFPEFRKVIHLRVSKDEQILAEMSIASPLATSSP